MREWVWGHQLLTASCVFQENLGRPRLHADLAALAQPAASCPECSAEVGADAIPGPSGVFLRSAEQHQQDTPARRRR